jgi:glycerol-3-phosphate responsive antiterminator
MASLASATSSRVDSASKHIVPCKMNTDYMVSIMRPDTMSSDAVRELQQNKMKYCMHKDDLVIGLGRSTYGSASFTNQKKAYPSVITTISKMDPHARDGLPY